MDSLIAELGQAVKAWSDINVKINVRQATGRTIPAAATNEERTARNRIYNLMARTSAILELLHEDSITMKELDSIYQRRLNVGPIYNPDEVSEWHYEIDRLRRHLKFIE